MLLKDKRIFIAEDNMQNRIIFQLALVPQGASIDIEYRGADTLYRLSCLSHVDLIILDLMLANGISGFDVCAEIRAQPRYSTVPIVAVSAMDAGIAVPQAVAAGFSGFIAKPINKRLFAQQIARILAGEAVWYVGESRHA
jgi:CheY-like chemotaxis protein